MDYGQTKKQTIRIVLSEAFMVLAVIATVIVLALLVSGYWLNANFEIERNGMLQISSVPTGATIDIDNHSSSWLERTNSSKILKSGKHSLVLSKEGYDSWSKEINISDGLLYRLQYPRLFLQNRRSEDILDAAGYTMASASPDRNALLLMNDTSEWGYLNLDTDNPIIRKISIANLFSDSVASDNNKEAKLTERIIDLNWDYDASHILFQIQQESSVEWVLLDINNATKSVNLTKEFGADFSYVEILDNNSNTLLAVRGQNLHKIDIPGRLISAVLVENLIDFDHFHNEIVFSAQRQSTNSEDPLQKYYVGYFRLGDREPLVLEDTDSPTKVLISKFYDTKYITVIQDSSMTIHQLQSYQEDPVSFQLSFSPQKAKVGQAGEFISLNRGNEMATFDYEANLMREWEIEGPFAWIDDSMMYTVYNNQIIVYDFDGLNRRVIVDGASRDFPVVITGDKWLYYFRQNTLVRDWIVE